MQNFEQGPQNAGFGPGYASGSSGYQPFGGQPQTFPNPQNQWYNQGPPHGGYRGGRGGGQNFQPRYGGTRPQFKKQFKKKGNGLYIKKTLSTLNIDNQHKIFNK